VQQGVLYRVQREQSQKPTVREARRRRASARGCLRRGFASGGWFVSPFDRQLFVWAADKAPAGVVM